MHFMAHAVMMPSGVPPIPMSMSTELSSEAAATPPATSPSMMRRTLAPAARISAMSSAWRGRSSTHTVMSPTSMFLASATDRMFHSVDLDRSIRPTASGPTAILRM